MTVVLHGGPLNGESVLINLGAPGPPAYGVLCGRGIGPWEPAYTPDSADRWTWRGAPDWPDTPG